MQTTAGAPLVQSQLDARHAAPVRHRRLRARELPHPRRAGQAGAAWSTRSRRRGARTTCARASGCRATSAASAQFNVLASHRMTWLNSLGAELRTDVQLGYNNALRVEFYQPFDVRGRYFIAPRVVDRAGSGGPLQRGQPHRHLQHRVAHCRARRRRAVRLSTASCGSASRAAPSSPSSVPGPSCCPPTRKSRRAASVARLRMDQLDSANFPRAGWAAELGLYDSLTSLGAVDPYSKWRPAATGALFDSATTRCRSAIAAGGKLGSDPLPAYDQFQWGGFLRQSGYATGQLVGAESSVRPGDVLPPPHSRRASSMVPLAGVLARGRAIWQSSRAGQPERSAEIDGRVHRRGQRRRAPCTSVMPGRGRAGKLLLHLGRPL